MRIDEVIDKQDLKLLKAEWQMLQKSDPEGVPLIAAKGAPRYNPSNTARVTGMPNHQQYPSVTSTKPEVKAMVADKSNSNLKLMFYILSWGGIVNRANNPKILYKKLKSDKVARTEVARALQQMRFGNISNQQAFDLFQGLRKQGYLPGLGVSFFTKVIYFLRPGKGAFILDQWTAKAMNYLHHKDPNSYPQVAMDGEFPANGLTGADYEAFNKGIKQVAVDVKKGLGNLSDEEAEFTIFGAHGKKFRPAIDAYHQSRTDLKKPKDNKFKYIQRAQRAKQDKEALAQQQVAQSQVSQSKAKAEELWNEHMKTNNAVSERFRQISPDLRLDFQQEFIDDVGEAIRNGQNPSLAILNVLQNYNTNY
jgi:hypothetical protein